MLGFWIDFLEDQSGSSLMEYTLLAAFVSVIIAGSLSTIGANTSLAFTATMGDMDQAAYETCLKTAKSTLMCEHP